MRRLYMIPLRPPRMGSHLIGHPKPGDYGLLAKEVRA
jgi:hypothetical protein